MDDMSAIYKNTDVAAPKNQVAAGKPAGDAVSDGVAEHILLEIGITRRTLAACCER